MNIRTIRIEKEGFVIRYFCYSSRSSLFELGFSFRRGVLFNCFSKGKFGRRFFESRLRGSYVRKKGR